MNKFNKRKCQMVLFQLEESLGTYVIDNTLDVDVSDNDEFSDITIPKKSHISDSIESAYLNDIFQYSLNASDGTAHHKYVIQLYNLFNVLGVFEVRNALAHPNRKFPDNYWYKVALVASEAGIQMLGLADVTSALVSAETNQLTEPPIEWFKKYTYQIPHNLPSQKEHSITGLVGRNKEIQLLKKSLNNDRIAVTAIVAPGGIGKTALALELLEDIVTQPTSSAWCDGVIFSTLKTEKLTSDGLVQLKAAETVEELKNNLMDAANEIYDEEFTSFEDFTLDYKSRKMLLFIDNLETLLINDIEVFEELNESLPRDWQVLITSRITVPHKVIALSELSDTSSIDLAKRYLNSRGAVPLKFEDLRSLCKQCYFNPLAIKLTLDIVIKGKEIPQAISITQRDISEFSFSNLIECLTTSELMILECIFIEHKSTRHSIYSLGDTNFDDIAASVSYLSKTSLIERNIEGEKEHYILPVSIRELLLRTPRDLVLRSQIQEKYHSILSKEKEIDRRQKKLNTQNFHPHYIDLNAPKDLKVLSTELFKLLKIPTRQTDSILGRFTIDTKKLTDLYARFGSVTNVFQEESLYHRSKALILAHLRDFKGAKASLEISLKLDPDGLSSKLFLGRLLMQDIQYHEAYLLYSGLVSQHSPEEENDQYYSQSVYTGLLLSLLYQNKYSAMLDATKYWKDSKNCKISLGLSRATAQKRIAEELMAKNFDEFLDKIISACGILNEIFRDNGYARTTCENARKLIDELTVGLSKNNLSTISNNKLEKVFSFCVEHLPKISASIKGRYEEDVNTYINRLISLNVANNPFTDRSWSLFISHSDPGFINISEADQLGLVTTCIDRIIRPKGILFSVDKKNTKYYSSVYSYQGNNKDDWYNLNHGDSVALKLNYSGTGEYAVSDELYIIE